MQPMSTTCPRSGLINWACIVPVNAPLMLFDATSMCGEISCNTPFIWAFLYYVQPNPIHSINQRSIVLD